jgi:AraC family transcriptional regulator
VPNWRAVQAEAIQVTRREPFEHRFHAWRHLLIVYERAARDDGETSIEGLPTSNLRDFSRKLSFVPAGHRFHEWQAPRVLTRVTYFYFDPRGFVGAESDLGRLAIKPRLFFFDQGLWDTALKLNAEAERSGPGNREYVEALGLVLMHEILRLGQTTPVAAAPARGGLAPWQQNRLAEFIDEHLDEDISLATLAELAQLSLFHFARAFKQSFGMPPHRYHMRRRMDRAKMLLDEPALSVTHIGMKLGFGETSSFTAAFRKFTGVTPTAYRRQLDRPPLRASRPAGEALSAASI